MICHPTIPFFIKAIIVKTGKDNLILIDSYLSLSDQTGPLRWKALTLFFFLRHHKDIGHWRDEHFCHQWHLDSFQLQHRSSCFKRHLFWMWTNKHHPWSPHQWLRSVAHNKRGWWVNGIRLLCSQPLCIWDPLLPVHNCRQSGTHLWWS